MGFINPEKCNIIRALLQFHFGIQIGLWLFYNRSPHMLQWTWNIRRRVITTMRIQRRIKPKRSTNNHQDSLTPPLLPPMERRNSVDKNAGILNNGEQDYTLQDIAEYIFWTGDEKRVALALNDFLQNELVSKQSSSFRQVCILHFHSSSKIFRSLQVTTEDLAQSLEDVKYELNNLRTRHSSVKVNEFGPIIDGAGFFFNQPVSLFAAAHFQWMPP